MNTLSWLIYLGGVSDDIQGLSILGLVLSIITLVGIFIYAATLKADAYDTEDPDWVRGHDMHVNLFTKHIFIPVGFALAIAVLPASSTVYAIAASEMGETVLNSETGGKAVQALNSWLEDQIDEDAEPSTD